MRPTLREAHERANKPTSRPAPPPLHSPIPLPCPTGVPQPGPAPPGPGQPAEPGPAAVLPPHPHGTPPQCICTRIARSVPTRVGQVNPPSNTSHSTYRHHVRTTHTTATTCAPHTSHTLPPPRAHHTTHYHPGMRTTHHALPPLCAHHTTHYLVAVCVCVCVGGGDIFTSADHMSRHAGSMHVLVQHKLYTRL